MSFEESDERPTPTPDGVRYASASRVEAGERLPYELPAGIEREQDWVVTCYLPHLEMLSDKAVQYVIAHELGHVVSGLRHGSIMVGHIAVTETAPGQYEPAPAKLIQEDAADRLVIEWGFPAELEQYQRDIASLF